MSCGVLLRPPGDDVYMRVNCPRCGTENRLNCIFGPYILKELYATGGMSLIYTAYDTVLDREVALKLIKADHRDSEIQLERFRQEAEMTAKINHPNIVQVFGVGEAHGQYYMALEMVRGLSLEEKFRDHGKLSEKQAINYFIGIVNGLKAAASEGFLHRDVKPANILISDQDIPKVIDFGLALDKQEGLEEGKEIWATPQYVAPEILNGEPEDIRGDMYALGATFYHLVAGKVPGKGHKGATLKELISIKQKIPPVERIEKDLRRDFSAVINKCMSFYSEHRYASYEGLSNALRVIRLTSRREERGKTTSLQSTKKIFRAKSTGLYGVLGLALLGGVSLFVLNRDEKQNEGGAKLIQVKSSALSESVFNKSLGKRIGEQYLEAHSLLEGKKYKDAGAVLSALRDDDSTTEPTATWSGYEVAISAWLSGDRGGAEKALGALREHVIRRSSKNLEVPKILPLLAQLSSSESPELGTTLPSLSVDFLREFGIALRDWEYGNNDEAVARFKFLNEAEEGAYGDSFVVYQKLIEDYLGDAQVLKKHKPPSVWSVKEAKEALNIYTSLQEKIKTKGRGRKMLREWQRRARRISGE